MNFDLGPKHPAWRATAEAADRLRSGSIPALFAADSARADRYRAEHAGIALDFSKQLLDDTALAAVLALAEAAGVPQSRDAMFRGEAVNPTEGRAVLHTLLRNPRRAGLETLGQEVDEVLDAMADFVSAVHDERWRGHGGEAIRDVVNIGIGGSHLGPQLVTEALRGAHTGKLRVHFVSNVDGGEIVRVLAALDPASTLFIVASKSFTTTETMRNAGTARDWLLAAMNDPAAVASHFVAVSANVERAVDFGLAPANVFPMWDWVGGRYSLWSAIGLPIALAIGMTGFRALLAGAASMDEHFENAPPARNLPLLLALLSIWNNDFLGAETHAVIPYDERLGLLPAYLQQLDMESNGKRVRLDNQAVTAATAPVLWGDLGTNAQHAFFQLLHQGTRRCPIDFIIALRKPESPAAHHDMLVANCFGQAQALMAGRPRSAVASKQAANPDIDLAAHREMPGNQPSNMLTLDELDPPTLGALLSLYEHRTFVQGVVWGINSFDQWGVELGKELADNLLADFERGAAGDYDASTQALVRRYLEARRPG